MIYLDNAATSLIRPQEVQDAVIEAMRCAGNAGRGIHKPALYASEILYGTRCRLAELFHIRDASRIAFTANATEALNIAIMGSLKPGDHVITTVGEHNSVLRPLYCMEKKGVQLDFVPVDELGVLRYEKIPELIRENTKAVVVTHASNLTGNLTDVRRIRELTGTDILLIMDAAQTAGNIPIDVERMGIDILCFTGHKGLLGPQGTGGIYVREGIELPPFKVGGSGVQSFEKQHPAQMPTALEAGTANVHGIAGLGAGVSYLLKCGVEEVRQRDRELLEAFVAELSGVPGIRLYGSPDLSERVGIVSLNIGQEDAGEISDELWERAEICVRGGAHCAPLLHEALGTQSQGAVRFSFSCFNTMEEIQTAARAVRELAREAEA